MVESTALEMRRTCKGIGGSNPSLSASATAKPLRTTAWIGCCADPQIPSLKIDGLPPEPLSILESRVRDLTSVENNFRRKWE